MAELAREPLLNESDGGKVYNCLWTGARVSQGMLRQTDEYAGIQFDR